MGKKASRNRGRNSHRGNDLGAKNAIDKVDGRYFPSGGRETEIDEADRETNNRKSEDESPLDSVTQMGYPNQSAADDDVEKCSHGCPGPLLPVYMPAFDDLVNILTTSSFSSEDEDLPALIFLEKYSAQVDGHIVSLETMRSILICSGADALLSAAAVPSSTRRRNRNNMPESKSGPPTPYAIARRLASAVLVFEFMLRRSGADNSNACLELTTCNAITQGDAHKLLPAPMTTIRERVLSWEEHRQDVLRYKDSSSVLATDQDLFEFFAERVRCDCLEEAMQRNVHSRISKVTSSPSCRRNQATTTGGNTKTPANNTSIDTDHSVLIGTCCNPVCPHADECCVLRDCAACHGARYCCKQCQVSHWADHKAACLVIRRRKKSQSSGVREAGPRKVKNDTAVSRPVATSASSTVAPTRETE